MSAGRGSFEGRGVPIRVRKVMHQTYAALRAKNQEPRIETLKALSKPKCKQCGQREMEFTEYRSPWHTKNDIAEIYHWMKFFAVICTTMDDKVHQAWLNASRQLRIPQLNIMDWWLHKQEYASVSELECGETITCSQLECSCTRVSSFELSMVQLPLPSADVR